MRKLEMSMNRGKIKLSFLVKWCIILVVIMDYNLFNIVKIPNIFATFWSAHNKIFPGMIAIMVTMLIYVFAKNTEVTKNGFLNIYLLLMLILIFANIAYSSMKYPGYSYMSYWIVTSQHLLLFMAIPIFYYLCRKEEGYRSIMNILNVIIFVYYIILIVQHFTYEQTGSMFMFLDENTRDNGIRLGLGSLGNIMIIYNFDYIYNSNRKKRKMFSIIMFVLGLYCMTMIQQTRGFTIAIFCSIATIIFLNSKTKKSKIRSAIFVFGALFILIFSGSLTRFFSTISESDYNIMIRFEAISYYWSEFLKAPLFGHGIVLNNMSISHGPYEIYFYSDVGIFGELAQYGLSYIIIFLWPVMRMLKIMLKLRKNKAARQEYAFLFGAMVYLITTSITLVVTNQTRMLLLPLLMAVFEYSNYEYHFKYTERKQGKLYE